MSARTGIQVDVRGLAVGGAGVGQVSGQDGLNDDLLGITAFVPFTIPGERVRAQIVEHKSRYLAAELCEIEESSADRVEPPCEYFGSCGGCELQHMHYDAELSAKDAMIKGALRAARLPEAVLATQQPFIALDEPYHYRRRVSLHIDASGRVGFYRSGSRSVVAVEDCMVSVARIREKLATIQALGEQLKGLVSAIDLEADDKGVFAILKAPYAFGKREEHFVLEAAKKHFDNVVLIAGGAEVARAGRAFLELKLSPSNRLMFNMPPGSFSQINWEINEKLITHVVTQSGAHHGAKIYDLYAGAGNFSLPLARTGAVVTSIECDQSLVTCGIKNAEQNRLSARVSFVQSSVERYLEKHKRDTLPIVVADPPRSGLGQLVSSFSRSERLVLVSCSLPSMVRDIRGLLEADWELECLQPFDMFARTSHVEIVTTFRRA